MLAREKIALGTFTALGTWLLLTSTTTAVAFARPAPPVSDCGTDAECLAKRFAVQVPTKVSSVVAAARLTSEAPAGTARGWDWVTGQHEAGLSVVTSSDALLEGTVLLAMEPAAADELVAGGAFRYV